MERLETTGFYRAGYDGRKTKKPSGTNPTGPDPRVRRARLADAGRLLLAEFLRLVAQLVGILDQLLLLGRILLEVGLQTEEQVLVDERLHVIRLDLQRVVDCLHAFADELPLLVFLQL